MESNDTIQSDEEYGGGSKMIPPEQSTTFGNVIISAERPSSADISQCGDFMDCLFGDVAYSADNIDGSSADAGYYDNCRAIVAQTELL